MRKQTQKQISERSTTRRALLSGGMVALVSLYAERNGVPALAAQNPSLTTRNRQKKKTGESTVVKNFTVLRKKPEMTKEEFYAQWEKTLAPLFAKIPGLTKYSLYFVHPLATPAFPATDDPVDGIAETWWASPEAVQSAMKTPEFAAAMAAEKQLFGGNDHFTHLVLVDHEVEVVKPTAQTEKKA